MALFNESQTVLQQRLVGGHSSVLTQAVDQGDGCAIALPALQSNRAKISGRCSIDFYTKISILVKYGYFVEG